METVPLSLPLMVGLLVSLHNHVQAGMVGVNVPIPVPMSFHCFGGWKHSSYSTLNVYGPDGVRFYTKMKTTTTRWPNKYVIENAAFSMPTL